MKTLVLVIVFVLTACSSGEKYEPTNASEVPAVPEPALTKEQELEKQKRENIETATELYVAALNPPDMVERQIRGEHHCVLGDRFWSASHALDSIAGLYGMVNAPITDEEAKAAGLDTGKLRGFHREFGESYLKDLRRIFDTGETTVKSCGQGEGARRVNSKWSLVCEIENVILQGHMHEATIAGFSPEELRRMIKTALLDKVEEFRRGGEANLADADIRDGITSYNFDPKKDLGLKDDEIKKIMTRGN